MGYLNPKNKTFKAWDDIGDLQFEFMLKAGLRPEHKLLDIGCGPLRGGKRFIPYLKLGNYYGVDKDKGRIADGREWLMEYYDISTEGSHVFVSTGDLSFLPSGSCGEKFDFIIAQSLFPHLSRTHIFKCLEGTHKVLGKEGRFFATFFEAKADEKKIVWDEKTITHSGADPGHQSFKEIIALANEAKLGVRNLGDWNHPRKQRMLEFGHNLSDVEKVSHDYATGGLVPTKIWQDGELIAVSNGQYEVKEKDLTPHKIFDTEGIEGTVTGKEVKPDEKPKRKKSSKTVSGNDSSGRGRKHRKVSKVNN